MRRFLKKDAIKYGLDIAILKTTLFDLTPITSVEKMIITIKMLKELLPFYNSQKIRYILLDAIKKGIIGGYEIGGGEYCVSKNKDLRL